MGSRSGVYVLDSTRWALPAALAAPWPGCGAGGRAAGSAQAALKVVLRWEVRTGALDAVDRQPGRVNDLHIPLAWAPLPTGALLLDDLGFYDLARLQSYASQGVYFLSRLLGRSRVWHEGHGWRLVELLRGRSEERLDLAVEVGTHARQPCRLLAVRVPASVAQQHRQRVQRAAQRHDRPAGAVRLELCAWNVLITNAPAALLGLAQAGALRRLRWQIELLFKVWKSEGQVDRTRGQRVGRVVCAVDAKLLAMVVQHWVTRVAGGSPLVYSPRRAARAVRSAALGRAGALGQAARLVLPLAKLGATIRRLCACNAAATVPVPSSGLKIRPAIGSRDLRQPYPDGYGPPGSLLFCTTALHKRK